MVWLIITSGHYLSINMQSFVDTKKVKVARGVVLVLCHKIFISQACCFRNPSKCRKERLRRLKKKNEVEEWSVKVQSKKNFKERPNPGQLCVSSLPRGRVSFFSCLQVSNNISDCDRCTICFRSPLLL
jgi:hypothetical protein